MPLFSVGLKVVFLSRAMRYAKECVKSINNTNWGMNANIADQYVDQRLLSYNMFDRLRNNPGHTRRGGSANPAPRENMTARINPIINVGSIITSETHILNPVVDELCRDIDILIKVRGDYIEDIMLRTNNPFSAKNDNFFPPYGKIYLLDATLRRP